MINRLQRQLIVHSVIYYSLNRNIWSDDRWDEAAKELLELKQQKPGLFRLSQFYYMFKDFDGSTGMHLGRDNLAYWESLATQLLNSVSI